MIILPEDQIPPLPKSMIVNEECVMLGVCEQGVIVQYIERDIAVLLDWGEIVIMGMEVEIPEPEVIKERREILHPHSKVTKEKHK